ncbi:11132_t:CDS:2, partial [Paraglomus occultum]
MRFLTLFLIFVIASANIFDVQANDLPRLAFKRIRQFKYTSNGTLKRRNQSNLTDIGSDIA